MFWNKTISCVFKYALNLIVQRILVFTWRSRGLKASNGMDIWEILIFNPDINIEGSRVLKRQCKSMCKKYNKSWWTIENKMRKTLSLTYGKMKTRRGLYIKKSRGTCKSWSNATPNNQVINEVQMVTDHLRFTQTGRNIELTVHPEE